MSGGRCRAPARGRRGAPTAIVAAGGYVWVTLKATGKVARLDPAGDVVETALAGIAEPAALAAGPDGALWVVQREEGAAVARLPLSGRASTIFDPPTYGADEYDTDIVRGPE